MANEAATTIVLRMKDEASLQMQQFGQTTQAAEIQAIQFNAALTAMGSALTAVGSLIGQVDSPATKLASTFLITGGAILTTTSAIIQMMPYLRGMITSLRSLAIAQAIVAALSGPVGWARIGIGLGVAAAATAGIVAATGGLGGGGQTVNINTAAFMGREADARQFGSKVQRFSREGARLGR